MGEHGQSRHARERDPERRVPAHPERHAPEIGRCDPTWDRVDRVLRVRAVWAEEGAPEDAGRRVRNAIEEMARWLGAGDVVIGGEVPSAWRCALKG